MYACLMMMTHTLTLAQVTILATLTFTQAEAVTRAMFVNALLEDYDSTVTPTFDKDYPTYVNVSLNINSIDAVNEQTMDISLNLFVTQSWHDYRLEFHGLIDADHLELDYKLRTRFWVPDLYFANEKSASVHEVTVPNALLHLYKDGTVTYKMRISLTTTCYMLLHKFPLDVQTCSLIMKSFGYTNKSLQFQWNRYRPLTRHKTLEMSQFMLHDLANRNCEDSSDEDDIFTCLAVDLVLHRNVGFYIIQLYIPSALVVVLSWVSFCLDVGAVPARISLGILTVLTMTNMKTIAVSSLPKVSYIKAMDIWMTMCLTFVFSSLLEFAVVNAFARRMVPGDKTWSMMMESEPLQSKNMRRTNSGTSTNSGTWIPDPEGIFRANQIDKFSMMFFPAAFLAFTCIYILAYK